MIDQLDGRTKLISVILISIAMFNFHHFYQYGIMFAIVLYTLGCGFNKDERRLFNKHWKLYLLLPLANIFINLFFINGPIMWSWGWLHLSILDLQIALRLTLVLMITLIFVIVTKPLEIALAVGKSAHSITFGRYKGVGIPLVVIIMTSFVSEFHATFLTVKKAAALRSQSDRRWFHKFWDFIFMLQPIILITLKKADRFSEALIVKGYHRNAPVFDYQKIKYHWRDRIVYLMLLLLLAVTYVLP